MGYLRLLCVLLSMMFVSLGMAVCRAEQDTSFKQENKPENLQAYFKLLHNTIYVKEDTKQAAALFQSLVPDEARLKKALRDDVATDTLDKILAQYKKLKVREEEASKLAKPNQTEVHVHGATTEELAKCEPGSVAAMKFSGGAKQVAQKLLRPGVTFYEVEFLEPGKDSGMVYHLMYWDGKQWSQLGPLWRMLRK